ncbi:hypothetical protein ABZV75_25900 [Streptomyces flaveolus]|uniref:iron-sulfur cluster-binding protein n=1 Tax=Streptomyces flaveolus TaxID=67297 RepID=UPI0033B9D1E3
MTRKPVREDGTVLLRTDYPHHTAIEVAAPRISEQLGAGQFVSVPAPPGSGPPGRWMFSPAAVQRDAGNVSSLRLVARAANRRPDVFGDLRPGDLLPLIGPLGLPLNLPSTDGTTVVVGVDHGAATAGVIARALRAAGRSCLVHVFVAAPVDEHAAPWLDPNPDADLQVEATPQPHRWPGRLAQLVAPAAQFVIAAPTSVSRTAFEACRRRGTPCWVLMEPFMACGIGLCLTCAVPVARGGDSYARACTDGPLFSGDTIAWQQLTPAGRPA